MAKKEPKQPEQTKEKKGKEPKAPKEAKGKNKKGAPANKAAAGAAGAQAGAASVPLSQMSPDQMTAAQIEQAIKESNDPTSRLKRLHSPISVKSCLLNILVLIVMTLVIVVVWCAIAVDKFSFVTVVKDMSSQFGITQGFQWLWAQISGWFGR